MWFSSKFYKIVSFSFCLFFGSILHLFFQEVFVIRKNVGFTKQRRSKRQRWIESDSSRNNGNNSAGMFSIVRTKLNLEMNYLIKEAKPILNHKNFNLCFEKNDSMSKMQMDSSVSSICLVKAWNLNFKIVLKIFRWNFKISFQSASRLIEGHRGFSVSSWIIFELLLLTTV